MLSALALAAAAAAATWFFTTHRLAHDHVSAPTHSASSPHPTTSTHAGSVTHAHSHPVERSTRPPLTPAEEKYIRELWPIHSDVQRNVLRVSLGQIFYKSQDLARNELSTRVAQALTAYREADARMRTLQPPDTLKSDHEEYLSAVRLFEESAVELQKMFADGREDHMLVAYPKSQRGSDKIREVGGKFWPNEFPPH